MEHEILPMGMTSISRIEEKIEILCFQQRALYTFCPTQFQLFCVEVSLNFMSLCFIFLMGALLLCAASRKFTRFAVCRPLHALFVCVPHIKKHKFSLRDPSTKFISCCCFFLLLLLLVCLDGWLVGWFVCADHKKLKSI